MRRVGLGAVAIWSRKALALAILVTLSFPCTAAALVPQAQRNALVALYNGTAGTQWARQAGWLGAVGSECSWQGVVCNLAQTEVLELDLENNRLRGALPAELGGLGNLVTLHLESNQLSGGIPASLGFTSLEFMAAGDNQLSGPIPDAFWRLHGLQTLDLRNNQLEGVLPSLVGDLAQLATLRLDNNRFSGPLPGAAFSRLQSLQYLYLTGNELSGQIPGELGGLARLKELRLDRNRFVGRIPLELANARSLEVIDLGANGLSDSIPPALGSLPALRQLSLGQCLLTGPIPTELGKLKALKILSLGTNLLDGSIPESLGSLPLLEELYLDTNQLGQAIPAALGSLHALRVMHLHRNQLSEEIPTLPASLTSLRLDSNQLRGEVPETLGSLSNLLELRLASNQLSGELPTSLLGLRGLQSIDLRWNAVTTVDAALAAFLDSRSVAEPFGLTQTVAPSGIDIVAVPPQGVFVRWTAPVYVAGAGGYELEWASDAGGPFHPLLTVADKTATTALAQGLPASSPVFLRLRTFTSPHAANQSVVTSLSSPAVAATTAGSGRGQLEWLFPAMSTVEGELKPIAVLRTGGVDGAVSVRFRAADGTAQAPADYHATAGSLTWPAGEAGARTFAVGTVADAVAELPEQLALVLSAPTGGVVIAGPATASLEIRDRGLDDLIGRVVSSSGATPAIAADPIGNRVVVWQDDEGAGRRGIFAAIFDSAGNPIGSRFLLNESTPAIDERNPTITPLGVELFVAGWEEPDGAAKARRVAIKVRVIELSLPFVIAPPGDPPATSLSLSKGASGEIFAAWRRGNSIVLRRFQDDGEPAAGEELLSESGATVVDGPALARDAETGHLIAVWSALGSAGADVIARRASSTGTPLGHELRLNQDPRGDQRKPTVVPAGAGAFLAAWQSNVQAASIPSEPGPAGSHVSALIVPAADGASPGEELRLNTSTAGSHSAPALTTVAGDDCVAAWITEGAGGPAHSRGRRLDNCSIATASEAIFPTAEPGRPVLSLALAGAAVGNLTAVRNSADVLEADGKIVAVELSSSAHACTPTTAKLCLLGGRLALQVFWRNQHDAGRQGQGGAVPYSDGSGYFWLFAPQTIEVAVKVIDGTAVNGHFWVFTASLSDVEYWLIVTDTATETSRTFHNPPGQLCGLADVAALPTAVSPTDPPRLPPALLLPGPSSPVTPPAHTGPCLAGAATLCLSGGRFEVVVDWSPGDGAPLRAAAAIPVSSESGFFWYFGPQMLELGVKLIDAQALTGSYWFFYSSLTDREYQVTVRDTLTGHRTTYRNPEGRYCGDVDFDLFGED